MSLSEISNLGILGLRDRIQSGKISAVQTLQAFLKKIEEQEEKIKAWEFIDPEYALYQAELADKRFQNGEASGALHGIPVGVKDIFDTYDMPTENGTVLHRGRQPSKDAFVVSLLRGAGAVLMGKTVTAELAYYTPGRTVNPHNQAHTPGGSSSGSAAAVASGMVPLAIGTQTNGSVIRPASFCGIVGFKPTYGMISRIGVLHQSWHLDQVGVFTNSIQDAALAAEILMCFDQMDPCMRPFAKSSLLESMRSIPEVRKIAFVHTPVWENAEPSTMQAFEQLAKKFEYIDNVELSSKFDKALEMHKTIMEADFGLSFQKLYEQGKESLSPMFCGAVERGKNVRAVKYNHAVECIVQLNQELENIFSDYDAILTPAVPGAAPEGLESTGSPAFCTIWTLCGVPSIGLPLLCDKSGLPLGVQLVGRKYEDARLLAAASDFYNAAS